SLMGTFAVMAFAGFSLDNLSLMALTVATGFVVDDAIVMIENIVRYLEQGKEGREAAEIGSREIAFTVLSLTVSLISMFVSLTLTPMMCAYLLKPGSLPTGDEEAMEHRRGFYARMLGWYESSLDWVLVHRRTTMLVAAASVAVTVVLYVMIPKDLLPEQDTGLITGVVQADNDIAFPAMSRSTEAVTAALRKDPAVAGVAAFIGTGSINPTLNQGQVSIVLKPRGQRGSLDKVVASLQKDVAGIPGVELFLKPVQDITLDTTVAPTEYQYAISEVDSRDLAKNAQRVVQSVKQLPEL